MNKSFCICDSCRHKLCAGRISIFTSLNKEQLLKLVKLIVHKEYRKGECLLFEGEVRNDLIIVNKGQVKAFKNTADGREQILYIFSEGDFFGEKNLLRDQTSNYGVEALEETHICIIHKDDFQKLVQEYPDIGLKVMEVLCQRLERLESAVESMGTRSVGARVSSVLLEFADKFGKPTSQGTIIELPLSREGIANYIGLTRETVSRKMSSMQYEGLIEMIGNKKVLLLDRSALEQSIE